MTPVKVLILSLSIIAASNYASSQQAPRFGDRGNAGAGHRPGGGAGNAGGEVSGSIGVVDRNNDMNHGGGMNAGGSIVDYQDDHRGDRRDDRRDDRFGHDDRRDDRRDDHFGRDDHWGDYRDDRRDDRWGRDDRRDDRRRPIMPIRPIYPRPPIYRPEPVRPIPIPIPPPNYSPVIQRQELILNRYMFTERIDINDYIQGDLEVQSVEVWLGSEYFNTNGTLHLLIGNDSQDYQSVTGNGLIMMYPRYLSRVSSWGQHMYLDSSGQVFVSKIVVNFRRH